MKKIVIFLLLLLLIPFWTFGQQKTGKIYDATDEVASFVGGREASNKFISKNLKYPPKAIIKEIEGTVYVKFVVEKDGKITNIKIVKSVDILLDTEALRVVKMMPKWKPAKKGEKSI